MDRMQSQPLRADVEDGQVVLDGRGIAATLTAADADTTARALAQAAFEANGRTGAAPTSIPPVYRRWSDDLEA
jgi:hypothetical protein